jgi:hypothetical protein
VALTASLGTTTAAGTGVATVTGLSLVGALGTVTASGSSQVDGNATFTGLSASMALGTVGATGDAAAGVTPLSLGMTLGVVTASGTVPAPVVGGSGANGFVRPTKKRKNAERTWVDYGPTVADIKAQSYAEQKAEAARVWAEIEAAKMAEADAEEEEMAMVSLLATMIGEF